MARVCVKGCGWVSPFERGMGAFLQETMGNNFTQTLPPDISLYLRTLGFLWPFVNYTEYM